MASITGGGGPPAIVALFSLRRLLYLSNFRWHLIDSRVFPGRRLPLIIMLIWHTPAGRVSLYAGMVPGGGGGGGGVTELVKS